MVERERVIQSVTVYKGEMEQTFAVGEEVGGGVIIEIVDKSTPNIPKFEFLDEDGQTIFGIENLPCQVEWMTIAVDGPAEEINKEDVR
ncbi:hypothetical protein [Paenibacillus sp. JDR-2]|uniref:hypothetical protein n=1 Tax=Paenibacillus sp. (strain JDR-2) TaxID=324057 RepID=UPI000166A458|nr:hypothetical protein [Paenibacillus sp. JDR-2]ACT00253.1 hypothetical protein Pjdr2_1583 [Paenibacillus sp. JDR-2]